MFVLISLFLLIKSQIRIVRQTMKPPGSIFFSETDNVEFKVFEPLICFVEDQLETI